ncbi:hypothetical protein HOY80DRAFT_1030342 [Tuber brumale]|nr:hypothetical protein HOY80DRAFT_1030342 [Tuber brumale]
MGVSRSRIYQPLEDVYNFRLQPKEISRSYSDWKHTVRAIDNEAWTGHVRKQPVRPGSTSSAAGLGFLGGRLGRTPSAIHRHLQIFTAVIKYQRCKEELFTDPVAYAKSQPVPPGIHVACRLHKSLAYEAGVSFTSTWPSGTLHLQVYLLACVAVGERGMRVTKADRTQSGSPCFAQSREIIINDVI